MSWHKQSVLTLLTFAIAALGLHSAQAQTVYFSDDFDSYSNADDTGVEGAGWTRTATSDVPGASFNEILSLWSITNIGDRGNPASIDGSPTTGNAMFADSDGAAGEDNPGQHVKYSLISPSIDTTGGGSPVLRLDASATLNNNGFAAFFVESSSDGGSTWDRLYTAAGAGRFAGNTRSNGEGTWSPDDEFADNTTAGGFRGRLALDLPASAANNSNVKVRVVEYEPNDDWWIAIDNVRVDDVARLTTGNTVVFSEDFNARDGTLGAMSSIAVTTSTFAGGAEQWSTLDQPNSLLEAPIYVPGTVQLTPIFEGRGVNRLGHPTPAGDGSGGTAVDGVPFAIATGFLATNGILGGTDDFQSILHTPVLDLSSLSEVILEYDSEGYTSSGVARVVLKETGGDGIDANDTVVSVIYDDNANNLIFGEGADHDSNGIVAGSDFLTQQRAFGGPADHAAGDTDGNGTVDGADIANFEAQYGGPPAQVTSQQAGNESGEEPAFANRVFSVPDAVGRNDVYFAFEFGSDSTSPLFGEGLWSAIDNVRVSGNVPALAGAVPEPGTLFLALLGSMMGCVTARRRRR